MITFTETIELEKMTCECGGVFALNKRFLEIKRREGGGYTCPYCKCERGWWESEADKLRKLLQAKDAELHASRCETIRERQCRESVERNLVKAKRKIKRAENGVCTLCNRSFRALARHMAEKHPDHTKCVKGQGTNPPPLTPPAS